MVDKELCLSRLKEMEIFQDFKSKPELILTFFEATREKKHKLGSQIILEGEIGDELFILIDGTVKIIKNTLQNDKYAVAILNAENSVFFGEVALIDSDKRSATVTAETPCTTLVISRDAYLKLCALHPEFGFRVTLRIAQRIARSLRKMNSDALSLFQALVDEVEGIL